MNYMVYTVSLNQIKCHHLAACTICCHFNLVATQSKECSFSLFYLISTAVSLTVYIRLCFCFIHAVGSNSHLVCKCVFFHSVDLCAADSGGGRSGHRSHLLVRGDRLQSLVSVRRKKPGDFLQRLSQLLGIHHRPQHHGAHFTICQVSKNTLAITLSEPQVFRE